MQNYQPSTENQYTIATWARNTFGEKKSWQDALLKALKLDEEYEEFRKEFVSSHNPPSEEELSLIGFELADMLIVMYGLAECLDIDLQEYIDKKMEINRRRTWKKVPNGQYLRTK